MANYIPSDLNPPQLSLYRPDFSGQLEAMMSLGAGVGAQAARNIDAAARGYAIGRDARSVRDDAESERAMREAVTAATDPITGKIDKQKLKNYLYKTGGKGGVSLYGAVQQNEANDWLLEKKQEISNLEEQEQRFGVAAKLGGAARANPGMWGAYRQKLREFSGIDAPEQFDAAYLDAVDAQAMDVSERKRMALQQMQQEAADRYNAARIGISAKELEDRRQMGAAAMSQRQAEEAGRNARWEGSYGQNERRLSGYYPKQPEPRAPAGTKVGKEWQDANGEWVQMIQNADGSTREVRVPDAIRRKPNLFEAFMAQSLGAAPPATVGGPSPAAQGREVTVRDRVTGQTIQAIQMPDGRLLRKDTGQPLQ